jgi:hypothetical protein
MTGLIRILPVMAVFWTVLYLAGGGWSAVLGLWLAIITTAAAWVIAAGFVALLRLLNPRQASATGDR